MQDLYIGLMSGTSLDALDAVVIDFTQQQIARRAAVSLPWPETLRSQLLAAAQGKDDSLSQIGQLHQAVAWHSAQAVQAVLAQAHLQAGDIIAIGSHGQTVRHEPEGLYPFSTQIGDPSTLAEATGIAVVCDFRQRDIAAGGQGAPLVPAFHAALLGAHPEPTVILNLGGIANVTRCAPGLPVIGFDTGPANLLMDGWIHRHQQLSYDADGAWARQGSVNTSLLQHLLSDAFIQAPAPKSTGREHFNLDWLDRQLSSGGHACSAVDVQATLLAFTTASVAQAIQAVLPEGRVAVCGGGRRNTALMAALADALPHHDVMGSEQLGPCWAAEWVEATAFAWLARQLVLGRPGNLPAVTGARGDRLLGGIYPGHQPLAQWLTAAEHLASINRKG